MMIACKSSPSSSEVELRDTAVSSQWPQSSQRTWATPPPRLCGHAQPVLQEHGVYVTPPESGNPVKRHRTDTIREDAGCPQATGRFLQWTNSWFKDAPRHQRVRDASRRQRVRDASRRQRVKTTDESQIALTPVRAGQKDATMDKVHVAFEEGAKPTDGFAARQPGNTREGVGTQATGFGGTTSKLFQWIKSWLRTTRKNDNSKSYISCGWKFYLALVIMISLGLFFFGDLDFETHSSCRRRLTEYKVGDKVIFEDSMTLESQYLSPNPENELDLPIIPERCVGKITKICKNSWYLIEVPDGIPGMNSTGTCTREVTVAEKDITPNGPTNAPEFEVGETVRAVYRVVTRKKVGQTAFLDTRVRRITRGKILEAEKDMSDNPMDYLYMVQLEPLQTKETENPRCIPGWMLKKASEDGVSQSLPRSLSSQATRVIHPNVLEYLDNIPIDLCMQYINLNSYAEIPQSRNRSQQFSHNIARPPNTDGSAAKVEMVAPTNELTDHDQLFKDYEITLITLKPLQPLTLKEHALNFSKLGVEFDQEKETKLGWVVKSVSHLQKGKPELKENDIIIAIRGEYITGMGKDERENVVKDLFSKLSSLTSARKIRSINENGIKIRVKRKFEDQAPVTEEDRWKLWGETLNVTEMTANMDFVWTNPTIQEQDSAAREPEVPSVPSVPVDMDVVEPIQSDLNPYAKEFSLRVPEISSSKTFSSNEYYAGNDHWRNAGLEVTGTAIPTAAETSSGSSTSSDLVPPSMGEPESVSELCKRFEGTMIGISSRKRPQSPSRSSLGNELGDEPCGFSLFPGTHPATGMEMAESLFRDEMGKEEDSII